MPNGKPVERVLFVYTLVGRGGDAVQVLAMQEGLRRLGHCVATVGPHAVRPYAAEAGTNRARRLVKRLPWWLVDLFVVVLNLLVAVHALMVARRFRPTLVLERATPYSLAGVLVSRLLRLPLIVHLDAPFAVERQFRGKSLFMPLHLAALGAMARAAGTVAVGSEASRDHYAAVGVPVEKLAILHNGVHRDDIVPAITRPAGPQVVGFVGSMARWHQVSLLLEALALLRKRNVTPLVHLVGAGEEYASVVRRARELGLDSTVRFFGPVSREEALKLIDSFHIAVLPHTLDTGSPMKLFEYAARGAAIVAPDLPNIRALWGENAAALFPPGDVQGLAETVLALLTDPVRRERLARNAHARVREQFTWERQLERILRRQESPA